MLENGRYFIIREGRQEMLHDNQVYGVVQIFWVRLENITSHLAHRRSTCKRVSRYRIQNPGPVIEHPVGGIGRLQNPCKEFAMSTTYIHHSTINRRPIEDIEEIAYAVG